MEIGKIQRIGLREVWPHEALHFTTWMEENIEVISEATGLSLDSVEREQAAGNFNVDLIAENADGRTVVIENQLGASDHDHLGKLLTYLTSLGADVAIWIVGDPRSEHITAMSWLNEASSGAFYLLKIETISIEGSPPAPLLTPIVTPSEEARKVGETKKDLSARYSERLDWWTQLLNTARTKTKLHANISPGSYSWVGTSTGVRGLGYNYNVWQHDCGIELYIDLGKDANEENIELFNKLGAHKAQIEEAFGEPLEWKELEDKRASKISKRIGKGGYRSSKTTWAEAHHQNIDAMMRLESALKPILKKLKEN